MPFTCEIKELPVQQALSVRTRSPVENLPNVIGQTYGTIIQYMSELGEQPAGAPFVAYYNMDMTDLDLEIGFPVNRELPGKGVVQPSRIPGGRTGTCMYTGPYQEIAPAYDALAKLIAEKGLEPTGVAYEIYYNSPMDTEPSKLQTLILFPIKS
ncbi:GyrI-like domain-containing protein [Methanocella arvoryzae]|uniref:Bacterial transcription activator n=1 Tax=Methanocella arvoryzae (strain DSM 22066 / NBRC 105507 / MRE50) TaxID=351160 RepID=Q0W7J0_METAR|nr:GyrI-like domain-containing protein [Methanocella arvoryzae]CAJ35653.1 putative bacterial transcription activator [Methanocella arvoryzae MRE50]